jgi:hypothetical protein
LAAAVAAALALASCGGSSAQNQQAAADVGPGIASNIRLADCSDWKQEPVEQRLATIHSLANINGQPIATGTNGPPRPGPVLSDKQAYDVLQGYCKLPFAGAFKLYKIYGRAAAFAGTPP